MICQQFEQLAPQIAQNELRDAKLLQDAINHAASCAACDATLVEARELAASVASLAAHDKSLDAAGHLEFTLRAAFVREHAAILHSRENESAGRSRIFGMRRSRFTTFGWHGFSLAGAAVIFAVLLFPRVLNHNAGSNRAVVTPAQPASPTLTSTKTAPTTPTVAPIRQPRLTVSHKPKKNPSDPETTLTGFLALPYADDLTTIQYGAIVRLQLSRADLAWYGLPVPISDTGQKITADLFVNGSGTPEAIRLVR